MIGHESFEASLEDIRMFHESVMDQCIDDLSSTLELAEALERQLEQVHRIVSRTDKPGESTDNAA